MSNYQIKCFILIVSILSGCTNTKSSVEKEEASIVESNFEKTQMNNSIMTFDNQIVDFGTLPSDTIVEAKYTFQNTGVDTLIIQDIIADCTCMGEHTSNKVIPPGEKGFISISLDTHGKSSGQRLYSTVKTNSTDRFYSLIIKFDI